MPFELFIEAGEHALRAVQIAPKALVGKLKIDGDARVTGDQPFARERELAVGIFDHVIIVLAARQRLAVEPHALGAGQNENVDLAAITLQLIRSLLAFDAVELIGRKFSARHRGGKLQLKIFRLLRVADGNFGALQLAAVTGKFAAAILNLKIAQRRREAFAFELHENLVDLIQRLRVALRLNRRVLIGERGDNFGFIGKLAGQLQTQAGIHFQTLLRAETHAARQAAAFGKIRAEIFAPIVRRSCRDDIRHRQSRIFRCRFGQMKKRELARPCNGQNAICQSQGVAGCRPPVISCQLQNRMAIVEAIITARLQNAASQL
ncbi:MAG: hypothetical protein ALAOOOJD_00515 [bacterium]|nr:hypothetical protein [bacterium]